MRQQLALGTEMPRSDSLGATESRALGYAIVDSIREPLVALDRANLRVISANRSFHSTFGTTRGETEGRPLHQLARQLNLPELTNLVAAVAPEDAAVEFERSFPKIGRRTMSLNACMVTCPGDDARTILIAFRDLTDRRAAEREKDELLARSRLLLREMQHRVGNSLQIIASILLMKARMVASQELRGHLEDAHDRVLAIASIQHSLQGSLHDETVALNAYLANLCNSLGKSMIDAGRPLSIEVTVAGGRAPSNRVVSLGLIVTELVINALKHAFPDQRAGKILVRYDVERSGWRLSVSDDGVGRVAGDAGAPPHAGLGTSIVDSLARQLDAHVEVSSSRHGTRVAVIHTGGRTGDE